MKKTYPSIPGLEPDAWSNDACRGYVISLVPRPRALG